MRHLGWLGLAMVLTGLCLGGCETESPADDDSAPVGDDDDSEGDDDDDNGSNLPRTGDEDGCSCDTTGARALPSLLALALPLAAFAVRRRRS